LRFAPRPVWFARAYIAIGNALGLSKAYATPNKDWGTLEQSDKLRALLTHDKDRFEKDVQLIKDNPALALGGVTFGWLEAAIKSCDIIQAPEYGENLKTPILIMQAGTDQVVDNAPMTKLAERLDAVSLTVIEGAAHEILRETDTIQACLWQAMDDFLIKWN
jgi:lysophospholipase